MNKYLIIGIVLVGLVGGGITFSIISDVAKCGPDDGNYIEKTVVSKKLEWTFEPESITVEQCDNVKLTVLNEDNFDHGIAIDALGVSQRLPASGQIVIEFRATKSGEFPFYCSVSCSDSNAGTFNLPNGQVQTGLHKGDVRGHFDHIGKFIVDALLSLTEGS